MVAASPEYIQTIVDPNDAGQSMNSYLNGNLVLELKTEAESELRGDVQSLKPEEAAILALLRGRLAKEAELSTSPTSRAKKRVEAVDGSR